MIVTGYPQNPDYGWLAKITQIEGTTASIEFEPTDSGNLVMRCNEQIRALKNDLTTEKDESIIQAKERAVEDLKSMITRIDQDGEIVGYVTVVLLIQAFFEKQLEERVRKVENIIGTFGGNIRPLTFKQKEGLSCVAPYGQFDRKVKNIGERNMPLSTFIGGFANASSGLNDMIGYSIGRSSDGKPIILDTWRRGDDRTNSNWFISGIPGVGKSATVKNICFREYALGAKIIFLDPEREYIDFTKNIGGKIINCGGGEGGRINPLQVRCVPKLDSEEGEDELFKDEGNGMSELALHFQFLRTFHRIYKKGISDSQISELERVLEKTYERFGITWDTEISNLKPKDFPVYLDFYEDLEKELEQDKENKEIKKLLTLFRSIAKGADAYIFNGHTDIEFDTDVIDLDISSLLEGDPNILRSQFHNINSFAWQFSTNDREEKVLYVVDEGYLIVDPENPEALIFVKNYSKRIRKYGGGILFITHSVVDVLDEAVRRHGQSLIDTACYKFIMGTDGKNLKETVDLFDLTEQEQGLLLAKKRGWGLLFAGSSRLTTIIEIPEKFLSLMGTAGGK